MAKKGIKIAVTYVITILLTLLIIGGICYLLLERMLNPQRKEVTPDPDQISDEVSYVPTAENNKTALFILDSEKRMSGCCFMVVRMIATEQRIVFMPVPADTCARLDGGENSVYEYYRMSGSRKAVSAVENALGIEIDYYLKLNKDSFKDMASIFGGTDYNVPYNLIYSNPDTGEETIYREGESYMDGDAIRKLITYPLYDGGEEYRAKVMGVVITDLINKNVSENFSSHMDEYFSMVINSSVETDFTAYDYAEQSEAMKYVSESNEYISRFVNVSGTYNENSLFVLDEGFLKAVPEFLKLDTVQEDTENDNAAVTTELSFPE